MNEKEKLTEKCYRCKNVLPVMDDEGKPNFFRTGSVGFGSESKYVCSECKLALINSKRTTVGFGL